MAESRLIRRSVKQSRRQLYLSLLAIVTIVAIAINFGPLLLSATGSLIDRLSGKSSQQGIISSNADLQAPTIDNLPDATPSAKITVSGRTDYQNGEVELYVNGNKERQVRIDNSQGFEVEDVSLSQGDNFIKARVMVGSKKSDFSEEVRIAFVKDAPKLDISSPSDKQSFSKADQEITVRGSTQAENTVSVNGFVAIVDTQGNFSHVIRLNDGENKLTVVSTNPAGNTTTKDLTVSYSP